MKTDLRQNLLAGLRLARSSDFSVGFDQAAALTIASLAVIVILSYPYGAEEVFVYWDGIADWAAVAVIVVVLALILARIHSEPVVTFATLLLSSVPWFVALVLLVLRFVPDLPWVGQVLVWFGAALVISTAWRAFSHVKPIALLAMLALAIIAVSLNWYPFSSPAVFYALDSQDYEPDVDIEQLYHDQTGLVGDMLDALLPQRQDHADIYFVGFAGNADEPVFQRDLSWVHQFIDDRFATSGRSVSLSATLDTAGTEALASRYNLRLLLAGIGQIIDPNEDSVFLYLTSHGAETGWLDVSLYPLPSQRLTAEDLRQALDDAGIRWRIIVISACYSGSLIETLANEQTLIMTAASADRSSFGCEFDSEMTWFADALFKNSLAAGMGLIDAFNQAKSYIVKRENEADLDHSDPQIFIGDAMRQRLEQIEIAIDLID